MTDQTTEQKPLTSDEMKSRHYFSPDKLAEGFAFLSLFNSSLPDGVETYTNFADPNNITVSPGFGVSIIPILKRAEKGSEDTEMKLSGVIFAQVPDFATAVQNPKAAEAIHDAYLDIVTRKFKSVINSTDDGMPIQLPAELDAFFERASRGEGLKAFLDVAKSAVKYLKEQGFKKMDVNTLRNIFMSEQFAKARYPRIEQTAWLAIMDMMEKTAKAGALDTSIYTTWRNTRGEAGLDDVDELDLSGLGLTIESKETAKVPAAGEKTAGAAA